MSRLVMKKLTHSAILLVLLSAVTIQAASLVVEDQTNSNKGLETNPASFTPEMNARSRYVAVPNALARFLFSNPARTFAYSSEGPIGSNQAGANGLKRSRGGLDPLLGDVMGKRARSTGLDSIAGVVLGKRSISPAAAISREYINLEPFFGRQYTMRMVPRSLVAPADSPRFSWSTPAVTSSSTEADNTQDAYEISDVLY